MNRWQEQVREFHEEFGARIGEEINLHDAELRAKLIMEEAVETVAAMGFDVDARIEKRGIPGETAHREIGRFAKAYDEADLEEVIDGMCDLIYVVAGAAVSMGIDLEPHFDEVHRANMTKTGGATREDGKILKPEGWRPPNHKPLIENQSAYHLYRAREVANGSA